MLTQPDIRPTASFSPTKAENLNIIVSKTSLAISTLASLLEVARQSTDKAAYQVSRQSVNKAADQVFSTATAAYRALNSAVMQVCFALKPASSQTISERNTLEIARRFRREFIVPYSVT